jgi:hypothetical protein
MPYIEQLIQTIDTRIKALNVEIASLEEARSALIANGASSAPVRQPRPATRRATGRQRRVLQPEAAERILAVGDGLTAAEVARQTGAGRDQVVRLLRDLESARRARRTGQGRGTRWHLLTDEDWIRERAEELAARRGAG